MASLDGTWVFHCADQAEADLVAALYTPPNGESSDHVTDVTADGLDVTVTFAKSPA